MAETMKRVFIRPPTNWDEMSEDEKDRWAESLLDHIVAQTATPSQEDRPAT